MSLTTARHILADALIRSLYHIGLLSSTLLPTGSLTILTFHRILPADLKKQYPYPNLVITPEEFQWILQYCTLHYQCGSLADICTKWEDYTYGQRPFLAITFDDGQADNYFWAAPILKQFGVRATFFVPAGVVENKEAIWHDIVGFYIRECFRSDPRRITIMEKKLGLSLDTASSVSAAIQRAATRVKQLEEEDRVSLIDSLSGNLRLPEWNRLMNWTEIRMLVQEGHEIGSHSLSHPILPKCNTTQIQKEISMSRRILRNKTNTEVNSFCFPNGDYTPTIIAQVQDAGYRYCVTTDWGINRARCSCLKLNRLDMISSRLRSRRNNALAREWLAWRLSRIKARLHP